MNSGIYVIQNLINHKVYIGSAINIKARWADHRKKLKDDVHFNAHLQSAWNKYGEENFTFWIIEVTTKQLLVQREQFFLDLFQVHESGIYNVSLVAQNCLGIRRTDEFKRKQSLARIGKKRPYDFCLKIRKANKGKKRTKEFCQRQSELKKQMWNQKHLEDKDGDHS
jgi:group I intron endonuclease